MKKFILLLPLLCLTACAQMVGGSDNTPVPSPLTTFKTTLPVKTQWSLFVGEGGAHSGPLSIAHNDSTLFTAAYHGEVTAVRLHDHHIVWQEKLAENISAGPGADANTVVVGTTQGDLIALSAKTGKTLWRHHLKGAILAAPTVKFNDVIAKTLDGTLYHFNAKTGKQLWSYDYGAPALVLRRSSQALVESNVVITGFASGKVAVFDLAKGTLLWEQRVASPKGNLAIERLVDIDATPIVQNNTLFVATYQGELSAIQLPEGHVLWSHALSTYTGLAVDAKHVFVSDTDSRVWAFDKEKGHVLWHDDTLMYRNLTAPAILGNAVVVGDGEGYLHFLSQTNGREIARLNLGDRIMSKPLVLNHRVYALTLGGHLVCTTT